MLDNTPRKIAEQRKGQLERFGKGFVGAVALDAQAQDAGASRFEAFLVRTEPSQLERSDTAKIEQIPGKNDGPLLQRVGEGHGLAGR